jgi:predicted permease
MRFSEWRSAWNGVRARGWSAVFVASLLGVALAANAVMFSAADSLVFRRDPFPDAERVIGLRSQSPPPPGAERATSARLLDTWREQTDLFSAVGGSLSKTVFLRGDGPMELVDTLDVTVGFMDVLGVRPRWGRAFKDGDDREPGAFAVILSEDLARRRFGRPERAPGQTMEASAGRLVVVGVMDRSFAYPSPKYQIWRALDPLGPLTEGFGGVSPVARVRPGVPLDRIEALVRDRATSVGASVGLGTYGVNVRYYFVSAASSRRTFVLVLAGAALCLLLAACASIASIELAGAVTRARRSAIQLALGASRGSVARIVAIEGALLVSAAFILATGLASLGTEAVANNLPDSLRYSTRNPIDLDFRVLAGMFVLASMAWVVATFSPILTAFRTSLVSLLKSDDRGASASRRATLVRRALTASQIAVAVALVIGALLFARAYRNLLAVDKGFDSQRLFSVAWDLPVDYSSSHLVRARTVLRETPGVEAVTTTGSPPNVGDSGSPLAIEIDGGPPAHPPVTVGRSWVDRAFFDVVRLPVYAGTLPESNGDLNEVVVPRLFARRFFPNGDAVGHVFRRSSREPWLRVAAVVGDFRTNRVRMPEDGDPELFYYSFLPPPVPQPAAAVGTRRIDTGMSRRFVTFTVRLNRPESTAALEAAARRIDPQLPVTVTSVDDRYARQAADTELAANVVTIFGWFSFAIAMAGVYGVMTFIVANRTREIGIRVALGAHASHIRRLVLRSSFRLALLGAAAGVGLAMAASTWLQSQLFGVSATDPATLAIVVIGVMATSLAATWLPARRAAGVDPAVALRRE